MGSKAEDDPEFEAAVSVDSVDGIEGAVRSLRC